MPRLGSKAKSIRMSQTSAARPVAGAAPKARSAEVYDLAEGQIVDALIPKHIVGALPAALGELTKYPPTRGIPSLIEGIRSYLSADRGLSYAESQVMVSNGAKQCLYLALQAICDAGDEVILFEPYWVSYPHQVRLAGAEPRFIRPADDGLRPDLERLESAVSERTRAIIVNSPSNPAGTVWTKTELEFVADVAKRNDLWLISDEVYDRITFDACAHVSLAALSPDTYLRTLVVNSASKSLAMPSIRIGFAAGPESLIDAMARQQSHLSSGTSYPGQVLAAAAMSGPKDWIAELVASLQVRRDLVAAGLRGMQRLQFGDVEGAIYFFPRVVVPSAVSGFVDASPSTAVAEELKAELGIAVVPGDGFGMPDHLRMNFAVPTEVLERVVELLLDWDARI